MRPKLPCSPHFQEDDMNRFARQIILPGFGQEAQTKLEQAKVLVIGAGGLGSPALLYLAAAGIGTIGIMDGDTVAKSNLNRQVIYGDAQVGINKAEAAAHYLKSKYQDIKIECIPEFITTANAAANIAPYDLIIDGSDNFPTRYLVNDICILLGKPLVFAAIYQNEGQIALFNTKEGDINYRDLFPEPPKDSEIPNCSETGVIGVLPGIMGTLQAAEAIKFLTGYGEVLVGKMLYYNLLNHQTYTLNLDKHPSSEGMLPKNLSAFESRDYALFCDEREVISWKKALELMQKNTSSLLIDVRELNEQPKLQSHAHLKIPFTGQNKVIPEMQEADDIYLFCQSGIRSLRMARLLSQTLTGKKIYSIIGGIESPDAPLN
ncbi:HesA/MoeB/ThiF family protein [Cecembia lonarensis]|uniref:Molybdopterin-synthase adenylyltransferase n=1 Tax=Cecembia lonarensis (strain CCUG 58316 / KCTC 22772 / LW9) TaxID=1225176 RepID=K1LDV5_CECL9|nr:HesA/MoeB/ThiF family protein [Cecembia lonarensis]EKB50332.1 putative adenylyltransferase/sulfurtransferase MoeZ [Cecembia lonarensis LW9]